ncbi:carboxymuconolactone decarboxylase family protein [Kitasatospora nipponensis]|uniref:Carboxymuconolactone decarboxylase family protein n=1 Tax=Kitasatospora nipponensis TaxID=258049 RepID=A0ABN1X147_9ACTN
MSTATEPATVPVPAPAPRMAFHQLVPDVYRAMAELTRAASAGLDPLLAELVKIRASMINGCAYCIDMHSTDALKLGEGPHRIVALPAWRETPFFTARERAALALTEAVTLLTEGHVPDAVYDEAAARFDQQEVARLISLIATINAWNRFGVATRLSPPARSRT